MTRKTSAAVVYVVAVLASRVWIALGPYEAASPNGEPDLSSGVEGVRILSITPHVQDGARSGQVQLAYRETTGVGGAHRETVPIVLLHGSPGSLQDFQYLASALASDNHVVVPDMLGFGRSTRMVSDYSFVAQAEAIRQLLDALAIPRAHVVAFSWGGGVAIELASRAPERVASLVLVSAIGVQEYEMLGRHELNHLVHGIQHAIVVSLDWLVPHFGTLSNGPIGRGYTRSFLDSDQRPLRAALAGWQGPTLIVHGRDDFLVPPGAAREHHRLVPQSRLVWIDSGHLVLWRQPDRVAEVLVAWMAEAAQGRLPMRSDATQNRLSSSMEPFDSAHAGPQDGLGWLVFEILVFVASMVSEDLTCAGVGLLVAAGQVPFVGGVVACLVALVLGDLVLYSWGRLAGPPLLRRFGCEPGSAHPFINRLRDRGGFAVLLGRFVPGARLPTYVAAGAIGFPAHHFAFWLVVAATVWAPLLVGASTIGGRVIGMQAGPGFANDGFSVSVLVVLVIFAAARLAPRLVHYRTRRLMVARWNRLRRWEFWPIWLVYGLLLPSLLAQMIRFGSVRLPTLVNAPIPGGGLAGESKKDIARLFHAMSEHAIPTRRLEPGDPERRQGEVEDFMAAHGLTHPIVLKPDVGERGRAVTIAHDDESIRRHLMAHDGTFLVQSFASGEEFGLFYWRDPGHPRGVLYSIARKHPRFVTGNGTATLERLILDDRTCLPMAEQLLADNANRLGEIPARGEPVRVTWLGTHSLGARFLEGEDLRSEALEAAVDRLSRSAGLDFGRYDVIAKGEEDLRRGVFVVIEFNGLTGEAANMYDPRYGLTDGLSILRTQWRRAFEIGSAHRASGRSPLSYRALFRLIWDSRA